MAFVDQRCERCGEITAGALVQPDEEEWFPRRVPCPEGREVAHCERAQQGVQMRLMVMRAQADQVEERRPHE